MLQHHILHMGGAALTTSPEFTAKRTLGDMIYIILANVCYKQANKYECPPHCVYVPADCIVWLPPPL